MNKALLWATYTASLAFIASGALNYGFSRFFMAVPFMVAACFIAWNLAANKTLLFATIALSVAAIVCNLTLERNPFIFPILTGGELETLSDVHYVQHSDGSTGLDEREFMEGTEVYREGISASERGHDVLIPRGTTLNVIGVEPVLDFSAGGYILLTTQQGFLLRSYYIDAPSALLPPLLKANKEVESPVFRWGGVLMGWPVLPLILLTTIFSSSK